MPACFLTFAGFTSRPAKERPSDLKWDPSKTVFFEEEELLEEFPRDHPLSQRVYSNSFTSRAMEIFWKSIEVKANSIFANIMSKRILEGTHPVRRGDEHGVL